MGIIRLLGRVLIAPIFVYGGWDVLKNPEPRVKVAAGAGTPNADVAVQLNALVMVVAGVLLFLDLVPRLSAAVLALTLVPTTYVGHRFWEKEGPDKKQQLTHFLKNLAMLGGLVIAVASGD